MIPFAHRDAAAREHSFAVVAQTSHYRTYTTASAVSGSNPKSIPVYTAWRGDRGSLSIGPGHEHSVVGTPVAPITLPDLGIRRAGICGLCCIE